MPYPGDGDMLDWSKMNVIPSGSIASIYYDRGTLSLFVDGALVCAKAFQRLDVPMDTKLYPAAYLYCLDDTVEFCTPSSEVLSNIRKHIQSLKQS
jgi:hypothetical protein